MNSINLNHDCIYIFRRLLIEIFHNFRQCGTNSAKHNLRNRLNNLGEVQIKMGDGARLSSVVLASCVHVKHYSDSATQHTASFFNYLSDST